MKTFITCLVSLSALALAAPALADHHGGAAEASNPAHDACMQMHEAMMARHEAGEDHDAVMASLSEDERAQAEACHAMMGEHHDGHGDTGEHHAEDGAHGDHAGEHAQEGEVEADAHAGHH